MLFINFIVTLLNSEFFVLQQVTLEISFQDLATVMMCSLYMLGMIGLMKMHLR